MYLCEVAIVSQLCISFPYVLHGLCEDYLTCDIAFNAVMPPSRASTRGRYSRIEGVTSWYQSRPSRYTDGCRQVCGHVVHDVCDPSWHPAWHMYQPGSTDGCAKRERFCG